MRLLFFLLFISSTCYAQTFQEIAIRCDIESRKGLDYNNVQDYFIESQKRLRECFIGLKFLNFKATATDGKTYSLEDFKGKIVLVNLWYLGCAPCRAEIPMFNELSQEYSKDFAILSFCLDDAQSILKFSEKIPLNFHVFPNSNDLIEATFKMRPSYPTNIFLDKNGKIVEFKTGGVLDEMGLTETKQEIKKLIDKELKK